MLAGDGSGDKALQLTSDSTGDKRQGGGGNDVYRRQETAVVAAGAAAVEDELQGRRLPMRVYGNERQQRETAETADWQQLLRRLTATFMDGDGNGRWR